MAEQDKYNEEVEIIKGGVQDNENKMKELESTLELYSNRLERASHLTEGLKIDKNNWISNSKTLESRKKNIQGDTLLQSAFIS